MASLALLLASSDHMTTIPSFAIVSQLPRFRTWLLLGSKIGESSDTRSGTAQGRIYGERNLIFPAHVVVIVE